MATRLYLGPGQWLPGAPACELDLRQAFSQCLTPLHSNQGTVWHFGPPRLKVSSVTLGKLGYSSVPYTPLSLRDEVGGSAEPAGREAGGPHGRTSAPSSSPWGLRLRVSSAGQQTPPPAGVACSPPDRLFLVSFNRGN